MTTVSSTLPGLILSPLSPALTLPFLGHPSLHVQYEVVLLLNHIFSKLRVLVPGEYIVPQFCPTPGCPVWFGQQQNVQEGCWKWSRRGVGLRVDGVEISSLFLDKA